MPKPPSLEEIAEAREMLSTVSPLITLSKRELFAALIMAGLAANPENHYNAELNAQDAAEQADALIASLADTKSA